MTRRWTGFFVVLASAWLAAPVAAQSSGAIAGTVTDESGGVLPGVNVVLSSPQGTLGASQQTFTDERGAYQFLRLQPGTYTVKAELQGFRPAEQQNIGVNADATARADLRMLVGSLEEGVTVTGESPLLDTTSALKQTVLSREVIEALPNRVDVWAMTRVIPTIVLDKVDVGGSEAFIQSRATVRGSSNESGYFIDGIEVSSLDGNGSGATFYLNPYAFQEASYQIGGPGSAIQSKGGLIYNVISRTGTNEFHGSAMYNGSSRGMSSKNFSPALRAELLAGVPAAALRANPNIVPGADILKTYDTGAWISGPIIRDKLWFSGSAHYQVLDQYPLGSYDVDGTQVVDDNVMSTTTEKVAWQISKGAQLSWFNDLHYKWIGHRNGTGTNVTSFSESRARVVNDKWPNVNQVKFTAPFGTSVVVDISYGRLRADDRFGQQPEVQAGDISRFDSVTNTYTVAWPQYSDNVHRRDQAFASFSYFKGTHDVRFGYQWTLNEKDSSQYSTSGMRAVYANGVPTSVNTYNIPILSTSTKIDPLYLQGVLDQGLYIQDKWTPMRKLVLNVGLRYETLNGWQDAACRQTTTFFAGGQCFDRIENAPDFKNLLPRFSAVYDLAGDGRTALKFAANRYDQPMLMDFVNRLNPVNATSDTRAWRAQSACAANNNIGCDLNGDLVPQINELGPSSGFAVGSTSRYAEDIRRPVSNEYSVELQHQLPGNMVVAGGYTHRQTRRNFGQRNMAVPTSTYIPLTVTEVNSGRSVTVHNQAPALRGLNDNLFSNESQVDTNYHGGDITVNRRMANGWSVMGGASWGKTTGDILGGNLNDPNSQQFRFGNVGNDVPWSYKLSGIYEAPLAISVSGTVQYYSGFPETTSVSVGSNTVALTQVTQTVVVQPRATERLPNVFSLDMSLRRSFRARGWSFLPRVDLYNLTNNATILSWLTQLGPTYHRASTIQHGRMVKLGFQVEF